MIFAVKAANQHLELICTGEKKDTFEIHSILVTNLEIPPLISMLFWSRPIVAIASGVRCFSSSAVSCAKVERPKALHPPKRDKYYKITKYVKPIISTVYTAGTPLEPGMHIPKKQDTVPRYAFEPMFFKRQSRGLFGGLQRKRAKTCSEAGNKNLRARLPNIQRASLWLETLNKRISTKVTTRVLKTIDKEGGLDRYLTKHSMGRIKTLGLKGWGLRYKVLKQREHNALQEPLQKTVYDIVDGKRITVNKEHLLLALYPHVQRDSYTPIPQKQLERDYNHLTIPELVRLLETYGHDMALITV